MIVKYRQRAKWMLFTMCFLIITKFCLSIVLSGFKDSLGDGLYEVLNIVDVAVLPIMVFVVIPGAFLVPYWYGRSKGIPSGETISILFSMGGFIKLIGMTDRSVEKMDNNQSTKTQ